MTTLSTNYLGLQLSSPLIGSASPLTGQLDTLKQLEEAGAGAVVLPSLFEEEVEHEADQLMGLAGHGAEHFAEALDGYLPAAEAPSLLDKHLELTRRAKEALGIPVIGSLNGVSPGGWIDCGQQLQQAGVDALELNIYFVPVDPELSSAQVEARYLELVASLSEAISVPLAIKCSPFFSAPVYMAKKLMEAGAVGLVLFNRFYQPDIDLEARAVMPNLKLSSSDELLLPLRWIAIMRGAIQGSLAATGGAHTAEDCLKLLLVGADAVMMASALLRHGPAHMARVLKSMETWMRENEYESISQLAGSMSRDNTPDPAAFERANYMNVLRSYTTNL